VERVKKEAGGYAFLMESTTVEYIVERSCDLTQGSISRNSISAEKTFWIKFHPRILDKFPTKNNIYKFTTRIINNNFGSQGIFHTNKAKLQTKI
jgi:hypothetical protein